MTHYYCACLCVCTCLCVHTCTNIERLLNYTFPFFTAPVISPPPAAPGQQAPPRALGLDQMCPESPYSPFFSEKQDNPRGMLSPLYIYTHSASVFPTLTCFPVWRWNSSYFWVECQLAHFSHQSHVKETKQMLLFALFLHWTPSKGNGICRSNRKGGIQARPALMGEPHSLAHSWALWPGGSH